MGCLYTSRYNTFLDCASRRRPVYSLAFLHSYMPLSRRTRVCSHGGLRLFPVQPFRSCSPQVYSIQPHPLWRVIMNVYAVLILSTLLLDYTLNLVADGCNLRALRHELPPEFADVHDAAAYRKSQEYTRVQTLFGILTSTCMLAVTLDFWCAGGFQALDVWVRSWHLGLIWTGLAYIGLLVLGKGLLSLPFTLYDTFV